MSAETTFDNCNHSKDPVVGCALEGIATMVAGIKDVTALTAIMQYSFSPCPSHLIAFSFKDVPHSCRKCCSIVIQSPQGCASTIAAEYDAHEVDFTKGKVGCTRLFESDIVMGASEKLKGMIKEADQSFDSKVISRSKKKSSNR